MSVSKFYGTINNNKVVLKQVDIKENKTMNKFAISLRKNVLVAKDAKTDNGNYDVVAYKTFRKFPTRTAAREFKRNYSGNPVVIINTATNQAVR